jgi:L-lactate utilization protein LutC
MAWDKIADYATVKRTISALKLHNIEAVIAKDGAEAKAMLLAMVPNGSKVFVATSTTLEQIGAAKELDESGAYDSGRKKISAISDAKERAHERKAQTISDYTVGSVHAVTEDGCIVIASASGSQLPGYAFNAEHVIWVVGTQKIVKNIEQAMERIEEYCVPLENERAMKAYGIGTSLNKILIIRKEGTPGRIKIIFVTENLGF